MDIVIKVEGWEGESKVKEHTKWTDLMAVKAGVDMPMLSQKTSNSRTTGTARHQEILCKTRVNSITSKLFQAANDAKNLKTVKIDFIKMVNSSAVVYMSYEMTETYISNVEIEDVGFTERGSDPQYTNASGTLPEVNFKLNYQALTITTFTFDETGTQTGSVTSGSLTGSGA
jgi:type VI secretion system Hcp family effector